ncbi:hypothetical protein AGMMS50229_02440 [Campylobacterota bacterium]|nr:hypothetical protein AGMMS50229_02440 [Campylobacterota bacterium]
MNNKKQYGFGVQPVREAVFVWVAITVVAAISLGTIYDLSRTYQDETINTELIEAASIGASLIDVSAHKQLKSEDQLDDELYKRLIDPLIKFHSALPNIYYVYTVIKQGDRFFFVLDTARYMRELRPGVLMTHSRVMDEYKDDIDPSLIDTLTYGRVEVGELMDDEFGVFKSAFAPFFDDQGELAGAIGVDLNLKNYNLRIAAVRNICLNGFLLFAALASVLSAMIAVLRTKTLRQLELAREEHDRQEDELLRRNKENEELLANILPKEAAKRLKNGEKVIADSYERVTVMFIDLAGFTSFSLPLTAREVVDVLNRIFGSLDELTNLCNLEKIKTIGDSYMAVGGLDRLDGDHMRRVALMALSAINAFNEIKRELKIIDFGIRIGIATGPVVAGVIGNTKFAYDLWGDTVNIASRMQTHSEPGKIHCNDEFARLIAKDFALDDRGEIEVRGKGKMHTFYLVSKLDQPRKKEN